MSKNDSGWHKNRLGPYRVLRRLAGPATDAQLGRPAGRMFAAVNTATGRPALLLGAFSAEHYVPQEEWRLRVRTSTTPSPYVALEVESPPKGASPIAQLDDGLDALACALERLHQNPDAAAHLCAPPAAPASRLSGSRWLWAAAAAALVALAVAPRAWRAGHPLPEAPVQAVPVAAAEEALAEPEALPMGGGDGRRPWPLLALDMPRKPFPGQYRTEKDGTCKGRREVPINGGCWIALRGDPPCGDDAYEHKGICYWPSMPSAKEPSSTVPLPRGEGPPAQRAQ